MVGQREADVWLGDICRFGGSQDLADVDAMLASGGVDPSVLPGELRRAVEQLTGS